MLWQYGISDGLSAHLNGPTAW